jgi:hypothetical protein
MLESGLPVVNFYVADIHGNEHIPGVSACVGKWPRSAAATRVTSHRRSTTTTRSGRSSSGWPGRDHREEHAVPDELGRGATTRVAQTGGRAIRPTAGQLRRRHGQRHDGDPGRALHYPAGSFGELAGNLTGLLATQKSNTTPFSLESDSAPEFYVTGNPANTAPAVRNLERDVSGLTASNPYTGTTQPITHYLADPTEQAIPHMVNADPAGRRRSRCSPNPTISHPGSATCSPCVTERGLCLQSRRLCRRDQHQPSASPGWRQRLGVDGTAAADDSAGPDGGRVTVPGSGTTGTWIDETDIRPT